MRSLRKNKRTIYYALYQGKAPVLDDNGYKTGEYKLSYGDFQKLKINVSASRGDSQIDVFGSSLMYDKTMSCTDMNCPIDENSILCIDIAPNNTTKDYDYIVNKVAKSLNGILYAISKVDVS